MTLKTLWKKRSFLLFFKPRPQLSQCFGQALTPHHFQGKLYLNLCLKAEPPIGLDKRKGAFFGRNGAGVDRSFEAAILVKQSRNPMVTGLLLFLSVFLRVPDARCIVVTKFP